jgi:hypothetical protein
MPQMGYIPPKCHQPAKNQQAKACWKMLQKVTKLVKISVVKTKKILCKFQQAIII